MNEIFNGSRAAAVAVAGILAVAIGGPASAGTVDFEKSDDGTVLTGPNDFAGKSDLGHKLTFGILTVSQGQLLTAPPLVRNSTGVTKRAEGNVYGSSFRLCPSCFGAVQIDFEEGVSEVTFTVYNPNASSKEYKVIANGLTASRYKHLRWRSHDLPDGAGSVAAGGSQTFTVTPASFKDSVLVPSITALRIADDTGVSPLYIDDIKFKNGAGHIVSFRTFIPSDNVPAGPDVSCVALPEMTTGGKKAPQVVRGVTASVKSATKRALYFAGDWPGGIADANSQRVLQSASVVPDGSAGNDENGDGRDDGTPDKKTGKAMIAFAEDAIASNEITDQAWVDWSNNNGGDCQRYHQTHNMSADSTNVDVGRINETSVAVRFSGSVNTPLGGKSANSAIDWDLTVTLDADGSWTVSGAHDGFPAYEISINEAPVYTSTPGAGPYSFSRHVRKLRGGMDVRANASGVLE